MTKIGISVTLERKLRADVAKSHAEGKPADEVTKTILDLVDNARAKAKAPPETPGVSYRAIVGALRASLGSRLVLPPAPTQDWISRQVARARELGLNEESVYLLGKKAAASLHGLVELEYILRAAARILSGGDGKDEDGEGRHKHRDGNVFTGRTE